MRGEIVCAWRDVPTRPSRTRWRGTRPKRANAKHVSDAHPISRVPHAAHAAAGTAQPQRGAADRISAIRLVGCYVRSALIRRIAARGTGAARTEAKNLYTSYEGLSWRARTRAGYPNAPILICCALTVTV